MTLECISKAERLELNKPYTALHSDSHCVGGRVAEPAFRVSKCSRQTLTPIPHNYGGCRMAMASSVPFKRRHSALARSIFFNVGSKSQKMAFTF